MVPLHFILKSKTEYKRSISIKIKTSTRQNMKEQEHISVIVSYEKKLQTRHILENIGLNKSKFVRLPNVPPLRLVHADIG